MNEQTNHSQLYIWTIGASMYTDKHASFASYTYN